MNTLENPIKIINQWNKTKYAFLQMIYVLKIRIIRISIKKDYISYH